MGTTSLPTYTRTIDNAFTQVWDEIQAQVADQILNATVVTAALKMKGCFKTQVGGKRISRTVRYALPGTKAVDKTDTFDFGDTEMFTEALWTFRNLSATIQRDAFSDRENRGIYKIRDYVSDKLTAAQDSLKQQYESDFFRAVTTDESGKNIQSLNDLVPPYASATTGTYGGIARNSAFTVTTSPTLATPSGTNSWWSPLYQQITSPAEVNLLSDMKRFYNTLGNQQHPADLIISDKGNYEIYTDFGLDMSQLVGNQKLLDLGFQTVKFMGQDMIWTPNITSGDMLFLYTPDIEVVYDPGMYFSMSQWKDVPNSTARVAHILCAMNIVSKRLRYQGRLTGQTVS